MRIFRAGRVCATLCWASWLGGLIALGCGEAAESNDGVDGTLRVMLAEKAAGGEESAYYYLDLEEGGSLRLDFTSAPMSESEDLLANPLAARGRRVHVVGAPDARGVLVVHDMVLLQGAEDVGTNELGLVTTGSRRVAVIRLAFPGKPNDHGSVGEWFFGGGRSAASFFQEASFGKFSLEGRVFGPYEIGGGAGCEPDAWARDGEAVARAAGVNLDEFQHVAFDLPATQCGWAGLGHAPGRITWLNGLQGDITWKVAAHELGHNFGLPHASHARCNENGVRVPHSGQCARDEYGDYFEVMGHGFGHFSGTNKARLGWLDAANMVTSGEGTYDVAPLESRTGGLQLLRVPSTQPGWVYSVENRQPNGFDAEDKVRTGASGVLIRFARESGDHENTVLLDMTPQTDSFDDAALLPGRSFMLPSSTTKIEVLSGGATGARVRVSGGGNASDAGSGFTLCASEGQRCTFSGTKVVRYGANGRWVDRTMTDGADCNNSVFGDPIHGTVKKCFIADAGGGTGGPGANFAFCANEGQRCTFPGTKIVRYGANGRWAEKRMTNSVDCTNAVFGDPIYGTVKKCFTTSP